MTTSDCKTCKYFSKQSYTDMGLCKRYPEQQNKHSTDWCGEHLAIKETTITLKHTDLPDTIDNLVAQAEAQEKRKPGRPKLSGRQIP